MNKLKRLLLACVLTLSVLGLAACGNTKAEEDHSYDWALMQSAQSYFEKVVNMDDEQIVAYIDMLEYNQNVPLANGYNSWVSAKKELGEFVGYKDVDIEYDSKGCPTITILTEFENRDCEFILSLNEMWMNSEYTEITQLTFNPVYTMGEKMQQAGTNLVIGMGTVFAVLVFLAWIISLFKYVHKAEEKAEKKKAEKAAKNAASAAPATPKAAAASTQVAPGVTITPAPANDELKAVIAAAVAAYEEDAGSNIEKQPPLNNGIVVKSFKRG